MTEFLIIQFSLSSCWFLLLNVQNIPLSTLFSYTLYLRYSLRATESFTSMIISTQVPPKCNISLQ